MPTDSTSMFQRKAQVLRSPTESALHRMALYRRTLLLLDLLLVLSPVAPFVLSIHHPSGANNSASTLEIALLVLLSLPLGILTLFGCAGAATDSSIMVRVNCITCALSSVIYTVLCGFSVAKGEPDFAVVQAVYAVLAAAAAFVASRLYRAHEKTARQAVLRTPDVYHQVV